jgi:hypothetical protein
VNTVIDVRPSSIGVGRGWMVAPNTSPNGTG